MARIGRHVRIFGRVQGVFFRGWTQQQADDLGVAGWVRNCPDGSVEAHLAGEEAVVQQLIERLRDGPPSAIVDRFDVAEAEPQAGEEFEVRH
ncbi:acylphosphatase [Sphingomonas sp. NSE70-1]|uniref:Acylphosphatase n=1 Tax=Sphingomonas caseinilyticus TaxID=2908205 RepID=A0ABT0RTT3_9SPHN|nr:acylphosphatase [Sphingomonas caseinilyticus]MCL6698410.1 acylphosphatase [Sphingomonas caseinilyticus]